VTDDRIHELASRQYGLFARSQAFDLGITNEIVHRRLTAGWWTAAAPGVYSLPGWPDSWRRRLWLAHLDVGLHSVVSHEAAAGLHGLTPIPVGRVTVTVPHGDHERQADYEVRQSTDLRPHHCTTVDGLPVTTPARTLVDLAARLRPDRLGRAVDDAHVARRCRIEDVAAVYDELRRPGKRGMRTLKRVLAFRVDGYVPPESVLERRLLAVLRKGGLPDPVRQAALPWRPHEPQRVDLLYPRQRVIVEADGRRWHSRLDRMADDRRRDREAQLHGHAVHRFVWEEITRQPALVCETVRAALDRAVAA
jgi:very-short-patch-repair endonuclease